MDMFSTRYKGVYVPSTHLSNCGKFNDVILNAEATVLENQNGCSLCTLFTHNQRKQWKFVATCGEVMVNRVCGHEHHPMLHL